MEQKTGAGTRPTKKRGRVKTTPEERVRAYIGEFLEALNRKGFDVPADLEHPDAMDDMPLVRAVLKLAYENKVYPEGLFKFFKFFHPKAKDATDAQKVRLNPPTSPVCSSLVTLE